jgi:hypothetical protein
MKLSAQSVVVALTDKQASVALDAETVVLSLPSGSYYRLDDVGTRVWSLLREPRSVEEIARTLASEYDVSVEAAESDVIQFLEQLAAEGLVTVADDGEGA